MDKKRVYTFGNGLAEGKAGMRNLLGGKGANLAEMNLIGVPVPPGFTITTDVCTEYYEMGQEKVVSLLKEEVEKAIANIENLMRSKFGDVENPLLVSVRSGARASMPGMMDTILNLGLNDEVVEGLTRKTGNARFAWVFGPEQMIRRFVKDPSFDQLICVAIAKHSDFKLEGIEDERTLLHARLIRDADKLDNCRVKLEESMETLLDMDEKTVGASPISPKVWESCKAEESVLSADRKTGMDYWMSYLALYFDINFLETYQIIKEQDYIRRIAERVPYSREDTKEKVAYTVKKLE